MLFSFLDLILLLSIFGFTLFGLWFGLIHAFGAFVGTVAGAIIAGQLSLLVPGGPLRVAAFVIIFFVTNRLVGFVFSLLERVFHIIAILPFLKSINRLGGGIFGLLEGVLVVGGALIVASRYNFGGAFTASMTNSKIAPSLVDAAQVLLPFLPLALKQLQSWVPWIKF